MAAAGLAAGGTYILEATAVLSDPRVLLAQRHYAAQKPRLVISGELTLTTELSTAAPHAQIQTSAIYAADQNAIIAAADSCVVIHLIRGGCTFLPADTMN